MQTPLIKNRFHILDLLRLVAAFGVVFYHYSIYLESKLEGSWLSALDFGYLGVNFFFMLSGFVIMASAENRGAFTFAISRAQRLYPAFIACLLFTVAIEWFFNSRLIPPGQVLWNATILNDYVKVANIDGVFWTLQAEIKFYACIFLLSFVGLIGHWRYWLSLWLILAIAFHFLRQPFFMGWFINPEYSFYFIGGVCSYLLYKNPREKFLYILLAISMGFAVFKAAKQTHSFMSHVSESGELSAQIVVGIFFIFFYLLAMGKLNIRKVPFWWSYLGAISYPLYLIHNRAGKVIIEHFKGQLDIGLLLAAVIFVLLCVCLVVHIGVEKNITRLIKSTSKRT